MFELKDSEIDARFDYEMENGNGKQINDAKTTAMVSTTKPQKVEPKDP